jgi:predicted transcriptional regulator
MSDKELVAATLERISPTATLDEIREELAILAAIRKGEAAADAGRTISHEEMERRSAQWISK